MNKLIKEDLEKVIVDNELETLENKVYGTLILYQCCICNDYKTKDGSYIKIHEALDNVFKTNPDVYEISHGYCDFCSSLEEAKMREWKRQRKKGL